MTSSSSWTRWVRRRSGLGASRVAATGRRRVGVQGAGGLARSSGLMCGRRGGRAGDRWMAPARQLLVASAVPVVHRPASSPARVRACVHMQSADVDSAAAAAQGKKLKRKRDEVRGKPLKSQLIIQVCDGLMGQLIRALTMTHEPPAVAAATAAGSSSALPATAAPAMHGVGCTSAMRV